MAQKAARSGSTTGNTVRTAAHAAGRPGATATHRSSPQKIANKQPAPNSGKRAGAQRIHGAPQTRGVDMKGGQPRSALNTMAGKSGKSGE